MLSCTDNKWFMFALSHDLVNFEKNETVYIQLYNLTFINDSLKSIIFDVLFSLSS